MYTINASSSHAFNDLRKTQAVVLAGGRGTRLYELTNWRAKPALYFGGQFRVVDFPLSNCVNSGIRRISVLTQYKAHSLLRHLSRGWSHFKKELGEFVEILPASQRFTDEWYQGTADAVFQNIDILLSDKSKYIIILSGDHIYRMDYGDMLRKHIESEAKMTISCLEVPIEQARGAFGVVGINKESIVQNFVEKPSNPTPVPHDPNLTLASMGNYVFNTDFLVERLYEDSRNAQSSHDFGKDLIPSIIKNHRVYAYPFRDSYLGKPYWRDVGTLDAFWETNMELLEPVPEFNLYDPNWPIWTYQEQLPPAKFVHDTDELRGSATDSMVSSGCIVSGAQIKRSILFSDVRVSGYSQVEGSVVLPNVEIGKNCRIKNAIIDRGCVIADNTEIGIDPVKDKENGFRITDKGIILVTRAMLGLPDGLRR